MNKVERERIETRRPYTSQQQGRQPCPRHRPRIIQPSLPTLRHRHLARAAPTPPGQPIVITPRAIDAANSAAPQIGQTA